MAIKLLVLLLIGILASCGGELEPVTPDTAIPHDCFTVEETPTLRPVQGLAALSTSVRGTDHDQARLPRMLPFYVSEIKAGEVATRAEDVFRMEFRSDLRNAPLAVITYSLLVPACVPPDSGSLREITGYPVRISVSESQAGSSVSLEKIDAYIDDGENGFINLDLAWIGVAPDDRTGTLEEWLDVIY